MRPIICLLGPTATGKTNLSIALAEQFDGEIISVDSALIYKGMDIGTAKPTPEERQGIVHHLIDIIEPEQAYSAANFCQDALRLCDEIQARGKTPILCGGTMMYFHALFTGLSDLPEADRETRAQITAQAEHDGWSAMHARLAKIDPDSAARIQPTDPQRLTRALEVYELTGHNLSFLCKQKSIRPLPYPTIKIALVPETRATLHARIEKRFELMLKQGFIDEVKQLYSRPCLDRDMPSMRCVGYRQVWQYLDGSYGYDVMVERGIVATRQLAKRQLTWLRGMEALRVFHFDDAALQSKVITTIETTFSPVTK